MAQAVEHGVSAVVALEVIHQMGVHGLGSDVEDRCDLRQGIAPGLEADPAVSGLPQPVQRLLCQDGGHVQTGLLGLQGDFFPVAGSGDGDVLDPRAHPRRDGHRL